MVDIRESQRKYIVEQDKPEGVEYDKTKKTFAKRTKIWIPPEAVDLHQRPCLLAYAGLEHFDELNCYPIQPIAN